MSRKMLTCLNRWKAEPLGGVQGYVSHHALVDGPISFHWQLQRQVASNIKRPILILDRRASEDAFGNL